MHIQQARVLFRQFLHHVSSLAFINTCGLQTTTEQNFHANNASNHLEGSGDTTPSLVISLAERYQMTNHRLKGNRIRRIMVIKVGHRVEWAQMKVLDCGKK